MIWFNGDILAGHEVLESLISGPRGVFRHEQSHLSQIIHAHLAPVDELLGLHQLSLFVAGEMREDDLNDQKHGHQTAKTGDNQEFISVHGDNKS